MMLTTSSSITKLLHRLPSSSLKTSPFKVYPQLSSSSSSSPPSSSLFSTTASSEPFYGSPSPKEYTANNLLRKLYPTHIPTTTLQKLVILQKSAMTALADPTAADSVAAFGDLTSPIALAELKNELMLTEEGRDILENRPVINETSSVDLAYLSTLPESTFGHAYYRFLSSHAFDPNDRPTVNYVDNSDLAYLLLRYRQSHDFYHVLFNLPPTVLGEVALKWVEMFEFKLGSAGIVALGSSSFVLSKEERRVLREEYVPWAVKMAFKRSEARSNGGGGGSLLGVWYERAFETDLDELRRKLCITSFVPRNEKVNE